tara:strand:+ start:3554 stop:3682 length:129 start_codon:yes stop_codon:yes gene_type:complete
MDNLFDMLVPSYYEVGNYEIIILQNPQGDLITLKIQEYEPRG